MSLLMKALEKAAKDRGDARAEAGVPATAPAKSGLELEPIAAAAPAASRPDPAPRAAPPARAPVAAPTREQAQAATVLQAGGRAPAAGGAGEYLRTHPILAIGVMAGAIAVAAGIYVYLQIFHPGLFVRQPPAPKGPPPFVAQAPPAAPAPLPLPAAPLLQESSSESAPTPAPQPPREKPQPAAPSAASAPAPGSVIKISTGSAEPVLNPLLSEAYAALDANRLEQAQRLYNQLLRTEPKSLDALLGLAAIATQQGNSDEAIRHYLQILDLDPRHALAQSGLLGLLGRADPLAAESRLKQLIARAPSAHLYFTLGNLYSDQSQWAAAQQAYFQAHHLEPSNPDYAYNLAVGLEHVSQPRLALGFYRRAVQLAAARGRANFNVAQTQERIGKLASQVE